MKRYRVHSYQVVRITVEVEETNQGNAIKKAKPIAEDYLRRHANYELLARPSDPPAPDGTVVIFADAGETSGFMVDEVGDNLHERTRHYDFEGDPA